MKKIAIWGAGMYGSRLCMALGHDNVDFFIDSDPRKQNDTLNGKKIYHPNRIENWEDLFVYVPYNFYDEIKNILIKKGLKENIDFIKYDRKMKVDFFTVNKNYEDALKKLTQMPCVTKNPIFFWGRLSEN